MSLTSWRRITEVANIPAREGRAVTIGAQEFAIFNVGDRFLAVDGRCPHKGGPLCDGIVSGDTVVCPLHAWKIGLTSGEVVRPAGVGACVRSYPVRVEDGIVFLGLTPTTTELMPS
jgi:nitrite reductase (NADH) small subunit